VIYRDTISFFFEKKNTCFGDGALTHGRSLMLQLGEAHHLRDEPAIVREVAEFLRTPATRTLSRTSRMADIDLTMPIHDHEASRSWKDP
jgi:hypothetical protein